MGGYQRVRTNFRANLSRYRIPGYTKRCVLETTIDPLLSPALKSKTGRKSAFARRESVISVNWNPKAGVLEIWRRREGGATSIDIPTDRFDIKLLRSGRGIYTDFTSEVFTISLRVGSVLGVATCTYFG